MVPSHSTELQSGKLGGLGGWIDRVLDGDKIIPAVGRDYEGGRNIVGGSDVVLFRGGEGRKTFALLGLRSESIVRISFHCAEVRVARPSHCWDWIVNPGQTSLLPRRLVARS